MTTSLDTIGPGLVLGRYELLMPIARGGMAAVWAARAHGARGFETVVAIKTMLPSLSEDPNAVTMFLDEARVASRVKHPNVVQVLDLGEHRDLLYQTMEWIDGDSLSVVMREAFSRGEMIPLPLLIRIAVDACRGLHAAHELKDDEGNLIGLVHRDVSPQNILLSMNGIVKVADFGIAKSAQTQSIKTEPGSIKGKIAYISPEQVLGEVVDRRTDIFALGIILYQLLTGKHPFRGDNEYATIQNLISKSIPPPRLFAPDVISDALDKAVKKALARRREDRFATALEMGRTLERILGSELESATTEALSEYLQIQIGDRSKDRRNNLKYALSEIQNRKANNAAMMLAVAAPHAAGNDSVMSSRWQIDPQMLVVSVDATSGSNTLSTNTVTQAVGSPAAMAKRSWLRWGVLAALVVPFGALAFWSGHRFQSAASVAPVASEVTEPSPSAPAASSAANNVAPGNQGQPSSGVDSAAAGVSATPAGATALPLRGAAKLSSGHGPPGSTKPVAAPTKTTPPHGGVSDPGF